ncbi:MAG: protein kinase [Pirellulales bacterium]
MAEQRKTDPAQLPHASRSDAGERDARASSSLSASAPALPNSVAPNSVAPATVPVGDPLSDKTHVPGRPLAAVPSQDVDASDLDARQTDSSFGQPSADAVSTGSSRRELSGSGVGGAPQERTVISKRAPPVEPRVIPTVGGPMELGRSLEGHQLGHFLLEKFVGGGGMGAVFRAADTKLSRIVAVKVMARDRTDDDTLRRFQNEAQSAARLDHPNIARVHYVGEDEGLNYIVFEYIEGTNIRDLVVARGPLPLEEAINYTLQVAEALEHAHQRDVVHRDIKPSNVLVMANGHVKLVDMGLARMHQVEASNADLTATGVTLGTFDYISPEQARDPRSADVRSDLYSLGCTLYYMLTGRPPFPDGTVLQKLLSHSGDSPPDVRAYRPELSEEVSLVVQRLLAKQPSQRFQTPSELIGALLLLADGLGFDRLARSGAVWVAPQVNVWTVLERQLPWAAPTFLFVLLVILLRWGWSSASDRDLRPRRPSFGAPVGAPIGEPVAAAFANSDAAPPAGEPPDADHPTRREAVNGAGKPSDNANPRTVKGAPEERPSTSTGDAETNPADSDSPVDAADASPPKPTPPKPMVTDRGEVDGPALESPAAVVIRGVEDSRDDDSRVENGGVDHSQGESSKGDAGKRDEGPTKSDGETTPRPVPPVGATEAPKTTSMTPGSAPAPLAANAGTAPGGGPPAGSLPSDLTTPTPDSPANASPQTSTVIRKLVVGEARVDSEGDELPESLDVRRFETLQDAFRAAVELPGVDVIELRYDGPRAARPFDISLPSRRVAVRAATGRRPIVVFQPSSTEPTLDRRMIRLIRTSLVWDGVPIQLNLPDAPSDDWTIFYLDRPGRVELTNVAATVGEPDAARRLAQGVAFFRFAEPIATETMMDMRTTRESSPTSIQLQQCVVRGPGALVRATTGVAFRLSWQQGLFASTAGLLEMQGARVLPQPSEVVSLDLSHVTLALGRPLCQMRLEPETRFPLEFVGKFQDCIFLKSTGNSGDGSELTIFEQQYGAGVDSTRYRPYLSGNGNYYPDDAVLLRISPIGAPTTAQIYTLRNRHEARQEKWYDEQPSPGMVMWRQLPARDLPVEKQSKNDYQLDDAVDNPASRAGFDPEQLPD